MSILDKNLSEEQIKDCEVKTETIEKDINTTQKEIDNYLELIDDYNEKIADRLHFIEILNKILDYRKTIIVEPIIEE